ncbi:MAG TPA: hypothetical protein VLQ93_12080, partial [Myxococcaceae bacterium]|nr:hypothetical protein [Myxococcaceae bacterium]
VTYYQDPWLSLRGRLLDGTHFQLGMVQKLQKRSRWVRNYRGKNKYKSKSKERALAWVQLRVKPEKHPQLEQLGRQARGAVRLPPGSSIRGLDVTAESISLEVVVGHDWEAAGAGIEKENASRLFAMMLMSCYQVLNLSRSLGKKSEMRVTG